MENSRNQPGFSPEMFLHCTGFSGYVMVSVDKGRRPFARLMIHRLTYAEANGSGISRHLGWSC